jgi:hypothetical protein
MHHFLLTCYVMFDWKCIDPLPFCECVMFLQKNHEVLYDGNAKSSTHHFVLTCFLALDLECDKLAPPPLAPIVS